MTLLVFFELGAIVHARDLHDVNRRLVELDVGRLKCLRYDPRNGEITEQLLRNECVDSAFT